MKVLGWLSLNWPVVTRWRCHAWLLDGKHKMETSSLTTYAWRCWVWPHISMGWHGHGQAWMILCLHTCMFIYKVMWPLREMPNSTMGTATTVTLLPCSAQTGNVDAPFLHLCMKVITCIQAFIANVHILHKVKLLCWKTMWWKCFVPWIHTIFQVALSEGTALHECWWAGGPPRMAVAVILKTPQL